MIDLHMYADEHAPFSHYQITIPPEIVKVRKDKNQRKATEETREGTFTVCYFCGHWVNRPLAKRCNCPASCHAAFDQEE